MQQKKKTSIPNSRFVLRFASNLSSSPVGLPIPWPAQLRSFTCPAPIFPRLACLCAASPPRPQPSRPPARRFFSLFVYISISAGAADPLPLTNNAATNAPETAPRI